MGGPCHKDRPVFRRSAVVAVEEAAERAARKVDSAKEAKERAHKKKMEDAADPAAAKERAEQRNAATARLYDALGLAEYEAIEAFVRWDGRPLD